MTGDESLNGAEKMKWNERRRKRGLFGRRGALFLSFLLVIVLAGCGSFGTVNVSAGSTKESGSEAQKTLDEHGSYTSKEDVALFLHIYGHLPDNYITKKEAEDLGWRSGVTLDKAAPGKSIGGGRFGNREGLLPEKKGRKYYECDIDYVRGGRNARRIVYSNDGLIFFTEDHYNTFEQLY